VLLWQGFHRVSEFSTTATIFVKSVTTAYLHTIADYLFVREIRLAFSLSVKSIIADSRAFVKGFREIS
jgi:hypothetical protein